ncbi:MAG TPA: hypothetical protein VK586_25745, partial [Streptosporangiaceae bacterium]|nr:hypothetical protein [Streptosporangiaceae bacterium]
AERRALLETVRHDMPDAGAWWEPAGWAHGDFHDLNVLWHGGAIAAVVFPVKSLCRHSGGRLRDRFKR